MSAGYKKLELIIKEVDRIAIFIDGHATQGASKSIDLKIDWKAFQSMFMELARVKRIGYYLAVPENIDENGVEDKSDLHTTGKPWWRSVVDWMGYNNYRVVLRQGREFSYSDKSGIGIKTSIDMVLAVDAMAVADSVDHVILFTGTADYTHLVTALQSKNVVVTVVSNSFNRMKELNKISVGKDVNFPFIASKALIQAANNFVDMDDFREVIGVKEG